ncbi:hypothetical protein [Snodgrassella sp. CFCC 13594]|uniref:hypothetical protein n=1 Tax=Snodgrassella sp. CFCC 13594 TaxID=1775559 RepID=UPI00082CD2F5|nr:hypothetical protein [Snodgrassella sp. CFCC 13594]
MSSSYVIRLVNIMQTGQMVQDELVAQVPHRMVRTQDPESLKQYVATQLNVPAESITSITPFYQ